MANAYSSQIIKDTTEHVVIKLTASFDGTGQESNAVRIAANTLSGALATNGYLVANNQGGASNTALSYYGLSLYRLWYDCAVTGDVQLYWNAASPKTMMFLNGNGEYDGNGNWITIRNTERTSFHNGDIGIVTRGQVANCSYTIILELRKENEYYQRGQFNDPAAFNYPPYNIRP